MSCIGLKKKIKKIRKEMTILAGRACLVRNFDAAYRKLPHTVILFALITIPFARYRRRGAFLLFS